MVKKTHPLLWWTTMWARGTDPHEPPGGSWGSVSLADPIFIWFVQKEGSTRYSVLGTGHVAQRKSDPFLDRQIICTFTTLWFLIAYPFNGRFLISQGNIILVPLNQSFCCMKFALYDYYWHHSVMLTSHCGWNLWIYGIHFWLLGSIYISQRWEFRVNSTCELFSFTVLFSWVWGDGDCICCTNVRRSGGSLP